MGAFAYAGNVGVFILAPFGWVIDASRRPGYVATLYQRGLDLNSAGKNREWMYINFWGKDSVAPTLKALVDKQEADLLKEFASAKIEYLPCAKREKYQTLIRRMDEKSYPTSEYTGFIEFEDFIFFCVMFSPIESEKRNLRKLEYVLQTVLPVRVNQPDASPKAS